MNKMEETFLQLVRLGIGTSNRAILPDTIDLPDLEALAECQGLAAILAAGLKQISDERIQSAPTLGWIHKAEQESEYRFEVLCRVIKGIIQKNEVDGLKTVILNPFCQDWPRPELRPSDDIYLWICGKQKVSYSLLVFKERRGKAYSYRHFRCLKSRRWMNVVLEECGENKIDDANLSGEKIYVSSPDFMAFFLIFRSISLFRSTGIKLCYLLDWAFFVNMHREDVDWNGLHSALDKYHMRDIYDCLNAICVEELGFDSKIFPYVQFDPKMKENVLNDILYPSKFAEGDRCLVRKCMSIFRQRSNNAWKLELSHK